MSPSRPRHCFAKTTDVTLKVDDFGAVKDTSGQPRTIKRFTWTNKNNVTVQVITYGGIITSIQVPDKNGKIDDIVLGFDNVEDYLTTKNKHYGATIGIVANRIAKATFTLEGVTYKLATNNGRNHLHGGLKGFDNVIWDHYVEDNRVFLSYHSADMEEGYPGDLITTVSFELTSENELIIDYKASVTKPCPVNLTNHSYFNLAGHQTGAKEIYKHQFTINADKVTEVDNESIPTGKLLDVAETAFDLRTPKVFGEILSKTPNGNGFDHNFCITRPSRHRDFHHGSFVAKAYHPESGRIMEVYSNQPGVQFYTGNAIPEDGSSHGKGATYLKHSGFCLETQIYPDAINHENFPNMVLYPGQKYRHFATFKFTVKDA